MLGSCRVVILALAWLCLANVGFAQAWAEKMFAKTDHNFGAVARGAKAQYRFKLKNLYEEDVHIVGVRSSCGCTSPTIAKPDIKTFEEGEIIADFNTRDMALKGHKSATLTVTFDKPFYAEVQLHVQGYIRSDVVMQPGLVELGSVDVGAPVEKRVTITYAGRDDWKITDIKTAHPNLEVEPKEISRGGGRVAYSLLVRLTKDAPAGYIKDQLVLVTNDERATEMTLDVEGRVVAAITVSPASLFMGVVPVGQKVTKQLIVKGKKPFRIVDVKCDDTAFEVKTTDEAKTVHVIPISFTASDKLGKIARQIAIETDQKVEPVLTAYAQIVKASPGSTKSPRTPDEAEPTDETPESVSKSPSAKAASEPALEAVPAETAEDGPTEAAEPKNRPAPKSLKFPSQGTSSSNREDSKLNAEPSAGNLPLWQRRRNPMRSRGEATSVDTPPDWLLPAGVNRETARAIQVRAVTEGVDEVLAANAAIHSAATRNSAAHDSD